MKGKFFIDIWDKRVKFHLDVERQITIIRGNSSTGKSYFIELVKNFYSKNNFGIRMKTNFKNIGIYTEFNEKLLKVDLREKRNTLFILEEDVSFVRSKDFARLVKGSDNYFIIINRGDFSTLPYSIWSIYEFESRKNVEDGRVYTETTLVNKFKDSSCSTIKPDLLITEDSKTGFKFLEKSLDCYVKSAYGNSNVYAELTSEFFNYSRIAMLVDGAAFGCFIGDIEEYLSISNKDVVLFAPESLEYLVLKSNIFKNSDFVTKILKEPYNYCDTKRYFSWERLFTEILHDELKRDLGQNYSKTSINNNLVNLFYNYRYSILSGLNFLEETVIKRGE